jgi:hypothetical protein
LTEAEKQPGLCDARLCCRLPGVLQPGEPPRWSPGFPAGM